MCALPFTLPVYPSITNLKYTQSHREQFESCSPSTNAQQVRLIEQQKMDRTPVVSRWQHLKELGSEVLHDIRDAAAEVGEVVSETMDEAFASPIGRVVVQHGAGDKPDEFDQGEYQEDE